MIENACLIMSQRLMRCKPVLRIRGFAIAQTTQDDIYAMQSQLRDSCLVLFRISSAGKTHRKSEQKNRFLAEKSF